MWADAFSHSDGYMKRKIILQLLIVILPLTMLVGCSYFSSNNVGKNDSPKFPMSIDSIPILVLDLDDVPGLTKAVQNALVEQSMLVAPSNTNTTIQKALILSGKVIDNYQRVDWHLFDPNGIDLGHFVTTLTADPDWLNTSKEIGQEVNKIIHSDNIDQVSTAKTRVKIGVIVVPSNFDGRGLRTAIFEVLRQRGFAIVESDPNYILEGAVQISRADSEKDLVKLTWIVKKSSGEKLGMVQQENAISRIILSSDQRSLFVPMAVGAVDGASPLLGVNQDKPVEIASKMPSSQAIEAKPKVEERSIPPVPSQMAQPPAYDFPAEIPASKSINEKAQKAQKMTKRAEEIMTETSEVMTSGNWVVQVASLQSEAEARRSWGIIKSKNANLLSNFQDNIVMADLGAKGIFWRLRVGPMGESQARALCANLIKQNQACLVAHF